MRFFRLALVVSVSLAVVGFTAGPAWAPPQSPAPCDFRCQLTISPKATIGPPSGAFSLIYVPLVIICDPRSVVIGHGHVYVSQTEGTKVVRGYDDFYYDVGKVPVGLPCTGKPQTVSVSVYAYLSIFKPGRAVVTAYVLVLDPVSARYYTSGTVTRTITITK